MRRVFLFCACFSVACGAVADPYTSLDAQAEQTDSTALFETPDATPDHVSPTTDTTVGTPEGSSLGAPDAGVDSTVDDAREASRDAATRDGATDAGLLDRGIAVEAHTPDSAPDGAPVADANPTSDINRLDAASTTPDAQPVDAYVAPWWHACSRANDNNPHIIHASFGANGQATHVCVKFGSENVTEDGIYAKCAVELVTQHAHGCEGPFSSSSTTHTDRGDVGCASEPIAGSYFCSLPGTRYSLISTGLW